MSVSAMCSSVAKTVTEDSPAFTKLPIMFAEIDFQPERVNSFKGTGKSISTIGSVGSPNINCISTGAGMCQLQADLASLLSTRGLITSCKSVLSSNESESITVVPVLGKTASAHVPSLAAKRYNVKRPPVLYCDFAMNLAYHAQICICITWLSSVKILGA